MSNDFSAFIELDGDDKLSPKLEKAAVAFDRLLAAANNANAGMKAGTAGAQAYATALVSTNAAAAGLAPQLLSVATATNTAGAAARNSANSMKALQASGASAAQQMAALQRGASMLGGPGGTLTLVAQGLSGVGGGAFLMGAGIAAAVASVVALGVAAVATGYAIMSGVVDALKESIKTGIDFDAQMETGRIGLAATILSYATISRANGDAMTHTQQFAAATELAADAQSRLRGAAFLTTATLRELQGGYGLLAAAGERAGASNEAMVELTKNLANLAKVREIPVTTAFNQMALILQGVARSSGRVAILMKGMGVDSATLKSWEKHGTLIENVTKKLEEYGYAGKFMQESFEGRLSNVKDVWEQFSGMLAQPLFELARKEMGEFVNQFVDLSGKVPKFREDAVEVVMVIGEAIAGAANSILTFSRWALGVMSGSVGDWKTTIVDLGAAFVKVIGFAEKMAVTMAEPFRVAFAWLKAFKDQASTGSNTLRTDLANIRGETVWGKILIDRGTDEAISKMLEAAEKGQGVVDGLTEAWKRNKKASDAALDTKAAEKATKAWAEMAHAIDNKLGLAAEDDPLAKAEEKHRQEFVDAAAKLQAAGKAKWGAMYAQEEEYITRLAALHVIQNRENRESAEKYWGDIVAAAMKGRKELADQHAKWVEDDEAEEANALKRDKYTAMLTAKLSKSYNDEVAATKDHHAAMILAMEQKYSTMGGITEDGLAVIAEFQAKFDRDDLALERAYAASKAGNYKAMGLTLVNAANQTVSDIKKAYAKSAEIALNDVSQKDNPAAGVYAGYMTIMSQAKTIAEATSDYIQDVYATTKQGINDLLTDVATGAQNFGSILRGISDGYLKDFSRMVTEMVSTWIAGQVAMGNMTVNADGGTTTNGGTVDMTTGGSHGGGQAASWQAPQVQGGFGKTRNADGTMNAAGYQAAGYGAAAAGFGSATGGAQSFGQGFAPYLSVAALAATIPVIGWIVAAAVAVVGLVVNMLSPDTEQHYMVNAANLRLNGAGDLRGGTSATDQLVSKSEAGQQLIDQRNKTVGTLFDLFTLGAPGMAKDLSRIVNEKLTAYLKGINFEVHAGSDEDIEKDFKYLFERVMPREMMARLFGATQGKLDIAGISGGSWAETYNLDQTAPITAFLKEIGFSMGKIRELASQSQTTDPALFMERLKKIVTVVIGFNSAMSDSAKSFSSLVDDYHAVMTKSAPELFADSRDVIVGQLDSLGAFTGDERLARAQTALDAISKRSEDMAKYVAQLAEAMDQAAVAVIDMKTRMQDALKNPEWIEADLRNMFTPHDFGVAPAISRIQNAATPDEAQRMFDLATSQLSQFFDILVARLHQAQQQIATNNALLGKYATFGVSGPDLGTMAGLTQGTNDLSAQRAAALAITDPQRQLDAIAKVDSAAEAMYEAQISMLHKIEEQARALTESVADQIRGMQLDGMSDEQRKSFLTSEIAALRAQIATTTDPAKLKEITDKIQADAAELWRMHQADLKNGTNAATVGNPYYDAFKGQYDGDYYAAFGAGRGSGAGAAGAQDPFAKFLEDILNGTNAAAQAAYAGMHTTVTNAAEQTKRDLELVGAALQNLITGPGGLNDEIQITIRQLDQLKDAFWHAMQRFGDAAIATNTQAFIDSLDIAKARFTDLNLILDPATGLPVHVKDAETSLHDLAEAARRLKDKFDAFDQPTTGGGNDGSRSNPLRTGSPDGSASSYSQVRNNRSGLRTYTQ